MKVEKSMKKVKDIFFILIIVLAIGIIIPLSFKMFNFFNSKIMIDSYEYNKNSTTLHIYPKSNDFKEKMQLFGNVTSLTISPFKYKLRVVYYSGNSIDDIINSYVEIDDLSCISDYEKLIYLDISGCNVTELNFTNNMNNLKTLIIKDTKIENISQITNLSELEVIDLTNCNINDYKCLLSCKNLKYVYLNEDQINYVDDDLLKSNINFIIE